MTETQTPEDYLVFETESFRVEQCRSCPLPGYLILSPKKRTRTCSDLEIETWRELGEAIATACRAVEAIIRPERIYIARFGEEVGEIHFHIFPRTRWLLDQYQKKVNLSSGPVSGPLIFDWSREAYKRDRPHDFPEIGMEDALREIKKKVAETRTE